MLHSMSHYRVYLYTLILLFVIGCKTTKTDTSQHEYKPIITEIKTQVDSESGQLIPVAIKGELQKGVLHNEDDVIKVKAGTPFELVLYDIDPDLFDLQYTFDNETDSASIKVIRKVKKSIIHLKNKCQIVNIGPGVIPEIILDDKLPIEQAVITPRYAKKTCEFIGYEIRYGSTERGCKEGRPNLGILDECRKKFNPPLLKTDRYHYWTTILFGG